MESWASLAHVENTPRGKRLLSRVVHCSTKGYRLTEGWTLSAINARHEPGVGGGGEESCLETPGGRQFLSINMTKAITV